MTDNPKPTILIAEDDVISRRVLEAFSAKRGYDTVIVANGYEALDLLTAADPPRLAILDWMMPGIEGPEVCRRLRAQSSDRAYIYILLLTARSQIEDLVDGLESGADDYITKPFNPPELDARLRVGLRILDLQDKLIQAREELRFRATHDSLTGLVNRGVILEALRSEESRQRRNGGCFGVILMDIDHFKSVNDTHGHLVGDTVLREVSRTVRKELRPYDVAGRYGGEEFLLVVPGSDGLTALAVAERLRQAIASHRFQMRDGNFQVSASFGIAASTNVRRLDAQSILNLADDALYRAKRAGRNRCELALCTEPAPIESRST